MLFQDNQLLWQNVQLHLIHISLVPLNNYEKNNNNNNNIII